MATKARRLKQKIATLPTSPGCYLFLSSRGGVLYIGKAVSLRSRVKQYFQKSSILPPKIAQMVKQIADIKVLQTDTEVEALILEANLIKKYKPKYNKSHKDDKRYAWIKITTSDPFPRIYKTREKKGRGRYFGPFPDGRPIQRTLKFLRRLYPYASCKKEMFPKRPPGEVRKSRLCLYYHLGLCAGPCDNLVTSEEYSRNISAILKFLRTSRESKGTMKSIQENMEEAANGQNFEEAQVLRDKMKDLTYLSQKIGIHFGDTEEELEELKKRRGLKALRSLIKNLKLPIKLTYKETIEGRAEPIRIECYDISNIQGTSAVGSMVVFENGVPRKSDYRKFKIRTEEKPDDVRMMREVLERRLRHLKAALHTDTSFSKKPDLIIVDGGKGQLGAALGTIQRLDLEIPALGIAKREEEIWQHAGRLDRFRSTTLRRNSPALYLIQQIRDEAHRFAISYHRKVRGKKQKKSALDEIPGVGEKRKASLLKRFGSVEGIKRASQKDIYDIVRNRNVAEEIRRRLSDRGSHKKRHSSSTSPVSYS